MADESATTTYAIAEPFEEAVRSLRRVLAEGGLKITGELDLSGRLRRRLLVETPPCLVLFARPTAAVLQGPSGHPGAAALTPLHIVVSAHGTQTEIHVMKIPPPRDVEDTSALAELGRFRAQLGQAIGKIGMRAVMRA